MLVLPLVVTYFHYAFVIVVAIASMPSRIGYRHNVQWLVFIRNHGACCMQVALDAGSVL